MFKLANNDLKFLTSYIGKKFFYLIYPLLGKILLYILSRKFMEIRAQKDLFKQLVQSPTSLELWPTVYILQWLVQPNFKTAQMLIAAFPTSLSLSLQHQFHI